MTELNFSSKDSCTLKATLEKFKELFNDAKLRQKIATSSEFILQRMDLSQQVRIMFFKFFFEKWQFIIYIIKTMWAM